MPATPQDVVALTRAIRQSHNLLRRMGDGLHSDLGLDVPHRSLLEFLFEHKDATAQDVARARFAPPDRIEKLLDGLARLGMAHLLPPQAGKRPGIRLSEKGLRTIGEIQRRELALVTELAKDFDTLQLKSATNVLTKISATLAELTEEFGK